MDRVKFYSSNDLTCGRNLKKSEELINEYETGIKEVGNINDVIELYNIKKYFDNKLYLKDWTIEYIEQLERNLNKLFGIIARNIKRINDGINFIIPLAALIRAIYCMKRFYSSIYSIHSLFEMSYEIDWMKI